MAWFSNYLSNRTQCIKSDGLCSDFVTVHNGVPQGSVLGPLLFIIYVNNLSLHVPDANLHFYADDTVIYSCGSTLVQAIDSLQKAFSAVQHSLLQLKLFLNADKTKLMLFSKSRRRAQTIPSVTTLEGNKIELVHTYKYLGILIDDSLTFKPHVENLVKNLKLKLRFYFQNTLCFSFNTKKRLVAATFLPVLDYGDILYMNASAQCLRMVDSVYHASLRFITNCKFQTHHCELYSQVGWPALVSRRNSHLYSFIFKAILGLLPSYICSLLVMKHAGRYSLRPHGYLLLSVPFARTELGKRAFVHLAPLAWNKLQKEWKMTEFISLSAFKSKLRILEAKSITCNCFN